MKQLLQRQHAELEHKNKVELTGNPFVDTGLAVIATLNGCKTIDDLTLRKIKNVHGDGRTLARNDLRLKSSFMIFQNSLITNPAIRGREKEKLSQYAKLTTAILQNIGSEEIQERCEICGNRSSIDIDKLYRKTIKEKKKEKTDKKKKTRNKKTKRRQYIDRQWFPLIGSMGSDAQALPSGSRPINICAKCLLAAQYLPQGVILIKGLLAVFQSTSIEFWYNLVKEVVNDIRGKLQTRSTKIESIGYKQGSGVAVINHLLPIMQRGIKFDPNTSLIIWLFSNLGSKADCELYEIPNFALNFLHKAALYGLRSEIQELIVKDKNTSFRYSFLNCISKRLDCYNLYPSKKFKNKGASSDLFSLYQTHVLNYPRKSLDTAYKVATYVNSKIVDTKGDNSNQRQLGIDIDREPGKSNII